MAGGGPAGSAVAAQLARNGRDVALFEKDAFPRDKLCGEFLSGEARRHLAKLGCLQNVLAAAPAIVRRARFFMPSGSAATLALPGDALGLSRRVFDKILLDHARRSGAHVWENAPVRGLNTTAGGALVEVDWPGGTRSIEARMAVGAYGRREALDKRLERRFANRDHPFIGFQRHHRCRDSETGRPLAKELAETVEVHLFDGGYCGINFVEAGMVNVCMLLEKRLLDTAPSPGWDGVCSMLASQSPTFAGRLAALEPGGEPVHAVAQIPFEAKEQVMGPVVFVGDAAGMMAPLCGDGQAMALHSGLLLADTLSSLPEDAGELWSSAWRSQFARPLATGRLLQRILLRPSSAGALLAVCDWIPGLAPLLFSVTR